MSVNPEKFSLLLHDGVTEIQKNESQRKKKTRKQIHEELGRSIGRKATTIEYYLQGNVPTSHHEIEQLTKEVFKRGQLGKKWLEDFLVAADYRRVADFIEQLTSVTVQHTTEQANFQCKRLRHVLKQTFLLDRRSMTHVEIDVLATSLYEVPTIRHRTIRSNYLTRMPRELEFIPIARSGEGEIQNRIFTNTPDLIDWRVVFLPPLQPNETATYMYNQEEKKIYPWTLEECREFFQQGMISHLSCSTELMISFPTDELHISTIFPANYDIALPISGGFQVTVRSSEDVLEKTRLIKESSFQAQYDIKSKQWTLALSVKNPRVGYTYALEWIPPSENSLLISY